MQVMMKCGCSTTAVRPDGSPVCITHIGLKPGFDEVDHNPPAPVEGRKAKCSDCGKVCDSSPSLPFFRRTEGEMDSFYNGCRGWD